MYGINSVYVQGFLLLVFVLLFVIIATHNSKKQRSVRLTFLFVILYFFSAVRAGTVGGDLDNYLPHFREVCGVRGFSGLFDLMTSNFEPGYTMLCWFISRLSKTEFVFLATTGFISLIGPFYLIKKYSVWPCISVLIYIMLGFYTNTFNNVRQSIAISIIFFSIPYIVSKKPVKFLLLVGLATSVHSSAFIFVFAYLLKYLPVSFKSFSIVLGIGYVVSSIAGFLIVQYLGAVVLTQYQEIVGEGQGLQLLVLYLVITFSSLFAYKFIKKRINGETMTLQLLLCFMAMASVIQMFAVYYSSIVRLGYYFYIPIIILLPNLINSFKSRELRFITSFSMFLVLFIYMSMIVYSYVPEVGSNSQAVIPYEFSF